MSYNSGKRHKSGKAFDSSSSHSSKYKNRFKYESDLNYNKSSELDVSEEAKLVFNYERHKYVLNKMFFSDCEKVKIGSKECQEFWLFLKKYQSMEVKAIERKGEKQYYESLEQKMANNKREIPEEWSNISTLMTKASLFNDFDDRYYASNALTKSRIQEFRDIAVLYLDFMDKQKAKALQKLKQMQLDLPIARYKDDILEAIERHSVILIAGDTGCGKSTQVPQYLLYAGYNNICCSQPRRIACISLRKRVAYETCNDFGTQIGYQIRFEKSKSKHTKILFLTEGLLLRQVSTDPLLSNYNVIILDEVHERHLSCDFLLGVMKCLVHQRSQDLKVILMSATINIELFSSYFGNCPVIQVPGRLYPIELQYFPISKEKFSPSEKSSRINAGPYLRIVQQIDDKYPATERGDLLVFLSGLTEINTVGDVLKTYALQTEKWIILYLHSSLSITEQDKVFDVAPEGVRKCILSTNIAETSLTIDGIRFVVDSGKVKEMSYDPSCRMQRLQEFWISIASAEQRKGRAGRTGPGVCYRLYSEKDLSAFSSHSTPEIRRVPLNSLLLQMISMGLPDARKFPFLEPPAAKSVEEALQSLKEQSALTEDELLTPMGKMLSRLPVDITIGKMLILSSVFNLTDPILSLAAALSIQSPITNKSIHDKDSIESRRALESIEGDPFTLLNAYNKWLEIKSDEQNSRKWCRRRGLEEQRFYEMTKLRRQFRDILQDSGLLDSRGEAVHEFESSADRIRRHGEVKQLMKMKREYDRNAPKKRKILKIHGERDSESDNENQIDVKDVEFRLSHDRKQVEALRDASREYKHRDITLMKLILCSGLHPQIAIADEHNSYKIDSEQMFHTKDKPFTILHPTGIFAVQPDLLRLTNCEQIKGFYSLGPLSTKHQLIAYVSLLETTKPYLCNCIRIPAAHVLLLVSNHIDTNYDFTRIVCDGWLELQFPSSEDSQKFISQALQVRDLWLQLLHKLFFECFESSEDEEKRTRSPEVRRMQTQLVKSIYSFIDVEIQHSLRRLLAADTKHLYVGKRHDELSINNHLKRIQLFNKCAKESEYSVHPTKGGLQITDYLTYNCLSTDDNSSTIKYLKKEWKCEKCGKEMASTPLEQVRHREKCRFNSSDSNEQNISEKDIEESTSEQRYDPLKILYFCNECQQKLLLTATQILKHKINHKNSCNETIETN